MSLRERGDRRGSAGYHQILEAGGLSRGMETTHAARVVDVRVSHRAPERSA